VRAVRRDEPAICDPQSPQVFVSLLLWHDVEPGHVLEHQQDDVVEFCPVKPRPEVLNEDGGETLYLIVREIVGIEGVHPIPPSREP
jgi:hypothetical protein